jgi:PhnB protein
MAKRAKARNARRPAGAARKPAPRRVSPVPAGYHTVTPYLTVNDGARALDVYASAFGARVKARMSGPGGRLMHAEFRVGDSIVMLSDEVPGMSTTRAPTSLGAATGSLFLYVPNVDAAFQKAVDAGCTALMPPTDMFWGDRFGKLRDPFGVEWGMATHKEDVPPKEMARRAEAAMAQRGGGSA